MVKTTIDIDDELWRKFSALMASRGIYRKKSKIIEQLIRDYVEKEELSLHEVDVIIKFEENRRFFQALKSKLERDPSYKGKFVAIGEGKIIDSDEDESKLIKRVYGKLGYVPIYVGFVGPERVLKIPSPELVR